MNNKNDLKGMFFIVKGQYKNGVSPTFINSVTKGTQFLGGYSPDGEETVEHYMVLDNVIFNCICTSDNLETIKRGIQKAVCHYKTRERYLEEIGNCDRRSRVSKPMRCLYEEIYKTYGDYYEELVEEQVDIAYSSGSFKTPLQRSSDIKKKVALKRLVGTTKKSEPVQKEEKVKPKLSLKPKKRTSLKKLSLS